MYSVVCLLQVVLEPMKVLIFQMSLAVTWTHSCLVNALLHCYSLTVHYYPLCVLICHVFML